jgi:murein DD-endopeptidase MepM/ murein hydrolase activator NlpD
MTASSQTPSATSPVTSASSVAPSSAAPSPSKSPTVQQQKAFVQPVQYLTSPWFTGRQFVGINYGCTDAPFYVHDPRCPGNEGFHHGIDISMPFGTPIYSNVDGVVVTGGIGNSYGPLAFRIRSGGRDYLLGHVSQARVKNGSQVRRGQLVALAGDLGAPDGSHLHFEVRPAGAPYTSALDPLPYLEAVRG